MSPHTIRQLLLREEGQDIIEYALLASFLGFSATAAVAALSGVMKNAYLAWDAAAQSETLVEPPEPK
jgi:Flp pilus assembly pilin Flp